MRVTGIFMDSHAGKRKLKGSIKIADSSTPPNHSILHPLYVILVDTKIISSGNKYIPPQFLHFNAPVVVKRKVDLG